MNGGPVGIPRLQEIDFLLKAHEAVQAGLTFDAIRRALIEHMSSVRAQDTGTGNTATLQLAREKPFRYVSNAADALKELMRLGFIQTAAVPSEPTSAPHYKQAK